MRRRDRRAMAWAVLAAELDRLAAEYHTLALALHGAPRGDDRRRAHDRAFDLVRVLDRVPVLARMIDRSVDLDLDSVFDLARVLDRSLHLARFVDSDLVFDRDRDLARNLAGRLESRASALRIGGRQNSLPGGDDRVETRVLSWLARLLPADEQSRFVAEGRGNLADCERWWQRVDHLVGLALGVPRLACMVRSGHRRSSAPLLLGRPQGRSPQGRRSGITGFARYATHATVIGIAITLSYVPGVTSHLSADRYRLLLGVPSAILAVSAAAGAIALLCRAGIRRYLRSTGRQAQQSPLGRATVALPAALRKSPPGGGVDCGDDADGE